jgi:hypothetical protein
VLLRRFADDHKVMGGGGPVFNRHTRAPPNVVLLDSHKLHTTDDVAVTVWQLDFQHGTGQSEDVRPPGGDATCQVVGRCHWAPH